MSKITQEDIDKAIQSCMWRNDAMGLPICAGNVLPCTLAIENGSCVTLQELFAKKEDGNDE